MQSFRYYSVIGARIAHRAELFVLVYAYILLFRFKNAFRIFPTFCFFYIDSLPLEGGGPLAVEGVLSAICVDNAECKKWCFQGDVLLGNTIFFINAPYSVDVKIVFSFSTHVFGTRCTPVRLTRRRTRILHLNAKAPLL